MLTTRNLLFIFLSFCIGNANAQLLIDPQATKETQALYKNLHVLSKNYTLFGHQDDLAYGVSHPMNSKKSAHSMSDIKDLVNDYPAVYGWDLGKIEHGASKNIDGIPFTKMRQYIQEGYQRGAVITLSWHLDNPLTGGSTWDTTQRTVASILPGGIKHGLYKNWLDRAATFMHSLKGKNGEAIPLLFRPFHELNGDWFWWGKNQTTVEEFIAIWKFTVSYLRNEKGLHNLMVQNEQNASLTNTDGFVCRDLKRQ